MILCDNTDKNLCYYLYMEKVFIFGATGMLGRYMSSYLKQFDQLDIVKVTRKEIDALKVTVEDILEFFNINNVSISTKCVVINCMGVIPQSKNVNDISNFSYFRINSIFPNLLATVCDKLCVKYIHITTDCVFSGNRGIYSETDDHDETNNYGVSKSLGELGINATVIRTSIIGEELKNKYSLLEWVRTHTHTEINGYTNHYWNGVTCLQLSKIIANIILYKQYWIGVRHIFSPSPVSKYELVCMINEIYKLNNTVHKFSTEQKIDKTLKSIYNTCVSFEIPELKTQITELQQYRDLNI